MEAAHLNNQDNNNASYVCFRIISRDKLKIGL